MMLTATSTTISNDYKSANAGAKQWEYRLQNSGEGEVRISDPLLDSEPRARERAKAEFLKNGYSTKTIELKTHRMDIGLNDAIKVRGLPYVVRSVSVSVAGVKSIATIRAVRYEIH